MTIKKIIAVSLLTLLISGCGTLKSVPYPTSFNSLDEKAVNFNLNSPSVDLVSLESQKHRKNQVLKDKDILVSVSGGGARASAFTLGILAELENLGNWTASNVAQNALLEIDYFSTVSGGGWGVSAYLANKVSNNSENYSLNDSLEGIKHNFINFSSEDIACLPTQIDDHITNGLTISDIFNQSAEAMHIPYLFVNGTIYSNQSPFVFTKEFSEYYKVSQFKACDNKVIYEGGSNFYDLPVSYAVATSGSVPGFYHNYATTNVCKEDSALFDSFFCSQGKSHIDKLILVDGGIYDNYGYQTAIEIMSQSDLSKLIIIIDANADTEIPFERDYDLSEGKVGFGTLMKAGFPARTSAYNRMFKLSAKNIGAKVVTLDFFSVADVTRKLGGRNIETLLNGLDILKEHSKNKVFCFAEDGTYLDSEAALASKGNSHDCISNNYYRSGLMGKTTYLFDKYYFTLLEQLGRFAVRLNAEDIAAKMYE